jgi:crotonobetainyl-CoA:carnitine CoA-transferase CaiB-like acyl-CoA transferase
MNQSEFFRDLKIVELAGVLAGPAVGMFFAELGAKVIKIENAKAGGDLTRKWKLPEEDPSAPASAYYYSVNWNKEVRMMDLSQKDQQEQLSVLLGDCDVVITNFRRDAEFKMGLDAESLRSRFPFLIIARITGYEDSDKVAYDAVLQAETGFMSMNGEPDGEPLKMPVALIDLLAAHQLKEAILLALIHRERTGRGSIATASLFGSAVASLANQASAWLNCGVIPRRQGSLHPTIAPYGEVFSCSDNKEIILAIGTDDQFIRMLNVMKLESLALDERFSTNPARVLNRGELAQLLKPVFKQQAAVSWLTLFEAEKVPVAPIRTVNEVFNADEARRMILEQAEGSGISRRVCSVAFRFDPE